MSITYVAGTNTLTLDGVNTYTVNDIYLADIAGGWGVVTKLCTKSFCLGAKIIIGDGTNVTQLVDNGISIMFEGASSASWQKSFHVKNHAILALGTLVSAANKITKNGVLYYIAETKKTWHDNQVFVLYGGP